jgi:hypothetical protein
MIKKPEEFLLADFKAIFEQHAKMWTVYSDSIKILVTVISLPLLAAAVLITTKVSIDLMHLPPVLLATVFITPAVAFFLLGVVVHHRLVILFYARALNGYRGMYAEALMLRWRSELTLPMPTNPQYPAYYEAWGPMGLIVRGSALVNGSYIAIGLLSLMAGILSPKYCVVIAVLVAAIFITIMELRYLCAARKSDKRFNSQNHSNPSSITVFADSRNEG